MRFYFFCFFLLLFVVKGQIKTATKTLGPENDITISLVIGPVDTNITLTTNLQSDRTNWFGIGFGNLNMSDTYSIAYTKIVNSYALFEQFLIGEFAGIQIEECDSQPCANLLSAVTNGSSRTIKINRKSVGPDANFTYQFSNTDTSIELIWAIGTSSTYVSHSTTKRGSYTLIFDGFPSPMPTGIPTASPTKEISANILSLKLQPMGVSGIQLGIYMNSTDIQFEMYGPSDRWFGIGWTSHTDGDALVFTTGYSGDDTPNAYDYRLRGQVISSKTENTKDTQQDWTVLENTVIDDNQYIRAVRVLDTGDSNDEPFSLEIYKYSFYIAYASSATYSFGYHGPTKWIVTVNLLTGSVTTVTSEEFTTTEHAIWMLIAWAGLFPLGAFIHRYRVFDCGICIKFGYLTHQLHHITMTLGYVCVIMGFVTQWANVGSIKFNDVHNVCGFIAVVVCGLQVLGSLLLYSRKILKFPTAVRDNDASDGSLISGIHKLFGMGLIGFGYVVIFLGILNYNHYEIDTKIILFVVYLIIVVLLFFVCETHYRINEKHFKTNVQQLNEEYDVRLPIKLMNDKINDNDEMNINNKNIDENEDNITGTATNATKQ